MSRIEGSQLALLIRGQLNALRLSNADITKAARKSSETQSATEVSLDSREEADSAASLQQRIGIAVRSIPPDNPGRKRKVLRVFLEAVLLQELGENLKSDPSFSTLVDQVQTLMEQDEALSRACARTADVLLAQAYRATDKRAMR
ncbi:hypothetical protein [Xylophilus sp. ASV27]|uniref:hypothetical protein n=1 Tax=Xylophilus sp. ASV27 TaxID=2795129 RepID=UPI0018EA6DC0|nr:hypothetical protein [Xylophilus sp. ASV27]